MDLQGKLGAFTLSDILQMFSFSGKTGTLTLIQGWNTRTITFERGRITYVAAATQLPSLLELLLQSGRLRKAEVEEVRITLLAAVVAGARQPVSDEEILRILIARSSVSPEDLKRCEAQQLERSVYALFLWRDCTFTFEADVLYKKDGIPVSLTSEHIILEGSRRVDEWIEISPLVPSVYTQFMLNPRLNFAELSYEEADVLVQLNDRRDVVALARLTGLTEFETAKRLYGLIQKGLVSAVPYDRDQIIRLFNYICETVYLRLTMYGYIQEALDYATELNRFAREHSLLVQMENGRIIADDRETTGETNLLLDRYKLFISVQNNRLTSMLSPEVLASLTEGLALHLDAADRRLLRMFEWTEIGGLFDEAGPWAPRPRTGLRRPVVSTRASSSPNNRPISSLGEISLPSSLLPVNSSAQNRHFEETAPTPILPSLTTPFSARAIPSLPVQDLEALKALNIEVDFEFLAANEANNEREILAARAFQAQYLPPEPDKEANPQHSLEQLDNHAPITNAKVDQTSET